MKLPEYLKTLGEAPLPKLNVKNELERIRNDPLNSLISRLHGKLGDKVADSTDLYQRAYHFYYQSVERLLPDVSLARRWRNGPYYAERDEMRMPREWVGLAHRYRAIANHIDFDFDNFVIHSRIMLDRAIGLSKYFLDGGHLPSFNSFNRHRKFVIEENRFGNIEYARYFRAKTGWFEVLREVRDKYVVHPNRAGLHTWGLFKGDEFVYAFFTAVTTGSGKAEPRAFLLGTHRLIRQVDGFLRWFAKYGTARV
ncbi:MAG: hypothetical protein OK422_04330 [Thaumarchaeota archaeon]|nr:hypothetical protein [Nitrososphaerota archaeon]